jgi:arylsulfatase A-like enzyme
MKKIRFKRLLILNILLLLIVSAITIKSSGQNKKPNIIVFYVDDLGWMDLSVQGSEFYETPAIDRLASEGLRFTQAYTAHPRCVPARYGVMTGKYPARGYVPGQGGLIPKDVTIAEAMKEGGYNTFFAGKWHLMFGVGDKNLPQNQGFDINIGGGHAGSPPTYFFPYKKDGEAKGHGNGQLTQGLENGDPGEYLTDRLTNESVKFIKDQTSKNPDRPFFLFLSHYGVHTPFEAKKELVEKYRKKLKTMEYELPEYEKTITGDTKLRQDFPVYAAMIESVDQSMAKIRKTLDELGIADNTIIIFTADNGGLSTRGNTRRLATSNYPLRYGKGWLYDGGIREAFIVKWPGITQPNTVTDAMIIGTDIYPTVLEMAGLNLHPENHKDGVSFVPVLKGEETNTERPLFWHSPSGRPTSTGDLNSSAVRLGDFKLIDWYDNDRVELFNIKNDIGEKHDLSKEMPEKTAEMLKMVRDWRKSINAVLIDQNDNRWYREMNGLPKKSKSKKRKQTVAVGS